MAIVGIAEGNVVSASPAPVLNTGIDDSGIARTERVTPGGVLQVNTLDWTIAMLNESRLQTSILATLAGANGGIFTDDLETLRQDAEQQANYDFLAPSTGP